MTRAVLYSRVSSEEQVRSGLSLEFQAEHCRDYCERLGWEVLDVCVDAGISAAQRDRPALRRALDLLATADCLVVWKLDRLARVQGHFWRMWEEHFTPRGKRLVSVTEGFDSATPAGRMLMGTLTAVAAYERELMGERVRAGQRKAAQEGRVHGGRRPPFGYRRVVGDDGQRGRLEPDPREAPVLRLIWALYLSGQGLRQIMARLNEDGITSPDGLREWGINTLAYMIRNPVYAGQVPVGGARGPGKHQALVTEEQWQQAQTLRALRLRPRPAPSRGYLLSGILRCRHCGGPMLGGYRGSRGRADLFYLYRCSQAANRGRAACRGSSVAADRVERLLIEALDRLARQERPRAVIIRVVPADGAAEEIAALEAELADVPTRRERLLDLAERGFVSGEMVRLRLERLEADAVRLRETLRRLSRQRPVKRPAASTFAGLGEFLRSASPLAHRKAAVAALVAGIVAQPRGPIAITLRGQ